MAQKSPSSGHEESTIRVLPEQVANQIAAGEVIDRPASVIKELVENALDAGAHEIIVIVRDGGTTLMQVIDDGTGMSERDLRLAFRRHATSKISSADDLEAITTLGFRGEALASIASVARVEARSARPGDESSTLLRLDGGELSDTLQTAFQQGTSIAVKNLFYNTPARRKFLKAQTTEYRHILQAFNRFVIGYPEVAFTLVRNDEVIYELRPSDLLDRIARVAGERYRKHMLPVDDDAGDVKISGFVGDVDAFRRSRGDQYLMTNRRYVVSKSLNHAVVSAYEALLPAGSFPAYAINLQVAPSNVDVNVHPTKIEVKFAQDRLMYTLLRGAVRRTLGTALVIPDLSPGAKSRELGEGTPGPRREWITRPIPRPGPGLPPVTLPPFRGSDEIDSEIAGQTAMDFRATPALEPDTPVPDADEKSPGQSDAPREQAPDLSSLWQIHNRYILAPIRSGLAIIDQHVAHERILYEHALRRFQSQRPASQQLLFQKVVHLSPEDYSHLMDILPFLEQIGFVIKHFGGSSVVIEAVPAELKIKDEEAVLLSIIAEFKNERGGETEIRDRVAKAFSCTAAVKSGDRLTLEEMNFLVNQLFETEMPYFCPHGRPVIVNIPLEELDRRFGRTK